MPTRVLIAAAVDPSLIEKLGADERFEVVNAPTTDEMTLAKTVGDAEILVTRYHNKVTKAVLAAARDLRLIIQGTSGLDNIDRMMARDRGVTVVGLPGENANAVAEMVLGLVITLSRSIPDYNRAVRSGRWDRDDCARRRELRAHRLGIVGLGRVGSQVARLAAAFGVISRAYDPYIDPEAFGARGAIRVASLDKLLEESDILTLHVPLTEETHRMIGSRELDLLPPGAIVINSCRGPVLDLVAALDRLRADRLFGLAVDVYDVEPPENPIWPDDPRLITTPHIAGCSRESKESIGRLIYEEICRYMEITPKGDRSR